MESLALGRPVIATQIAGHPELIDDRVGWLVPPGDSLALAAAMADSLDSTDLVEMGREGRARVEWMHDAKKEAKRLLSLMTAAVHTGFVPAWDPELDETYATPQVNERQVV
jgi:glycosyltransferase involved in cell wall biosynthesis